MSFTRCTNFARRSRYFCLILAVRLCLGGSVCWACAAGKTAVNATATAMMQIVFFIIFSPWLGHLIGRRGRQQYAAQYPTAIAAADDPPRMREPPKSKNATRDWAAFDSMCRGI